MAPSCQLPDLPSLCLPFELQTNRSCRVVTLAAEAWLVGLHNTHDLGYVLTESEQSSLPAMKIGLLAALCFPRCDGTPLRLLTDFLHFLVLAEERMRIHHGHGRVTEMNQSERRVANTKNGLTRLGEHELFRLVPQIVRLSTKASPTWDAQFTHSVNSYFDAQLQLMNYRSSSIVPCVPVKEYLELRRSLYGFGIALDLLELTENMMLPSVDAYVTGKMAHLKQLALDIISCSLDVASYNRDQAQGNRYNLITIFMTHNGLSVQGALNLAGVHIKDLFDLFVANERTLMNTRVSTPPQPNHSGSTSLYSRAWNWLPFSGVSAPPSQLISETPQHERGDEPLDDISSYVQALRDCVVGTINWVYETELYFGKKGDEIRTFGWVFLSQNLQPDREESGTL